MKRSIIFFFTAMLVFGVAGHASATLYTGSITSTIDGGMTATGKWNDGGATLEWNVENNANSWVYTYDFSVNEKDLSHAIIEVSDNFLEDNTVPPSLGVLDFYTRDGQGNSNPGMPDSGIYGIKGETEDPINWSSNGTYSWTWSITTNRMPMWGDFYAKSGKSGGPGGGDWNYAYNTGFGTDTTAPISNGNAMDGNGNAWVLVPDTQTTPVPEPATLLLLGTGLLFAAGIGRRKFFKKQ